MGFVTAKKVNYLSVYLSYGSLLTLLLFQNVDRQTLKWNPRPGKVSMSFLDRLE